MLVNVLEGGWCLCLVVRNVTITLERQANNGDNGSSLLRDDEAANRGTL